MNDQSPFHIYTQEKKKHEEELQKLKKKQNLLGWLRLGIVLIAAVLAFYLFTISLVFGWMAVAIGIGFFLAIVSVDTDNNKKIAYLKLLIRINEEELDSLNGIYS